MKNYDLTTLQGEQWKDVVGYTGIYSISNYGRVWSHERMSHGIRSRLVKARIMKQHIVKNTCKKVTHLAVSLSIDGEKKNIAVHTLVGRAFIRTLQRPKGIINSPDGEVYCHKNQDIYDNNVNNIVITSMSQMIKAGHRVGSREIPMRAKQLAMEVTIESNNYEKENNGYDSAGVLVSRKCKVCGETLPIKEYYLHTKGVYRRDCKQCYKVKRPIPSLINKG